MLVRKSYTGGKIQRRMRTRKSHSEQTKARGRMIKQTNEQQTNKWNKRILRRERRKKRGKQKMDDDKVIVFGSAVVIRLKLQSSENILGLSSVQCSTATASATNSALTLPGKAAYA